MKPHERTRFTWDFDDGSVMIGIDGNHAYITVACGMELLHRVVAQLQTEREGNAGGLLSEAEAIKETISQTLGDGA